MQVIGLGFDLVEVERIAAQCPTRDCAFVRRVFTPIEIEYCFGKAHPYESLAARFAVKESVSKALGTGIGAQCGMLDISTVRDELGAPSVVLTGAALSIAQARGITAWQVSISHTRTTAGAVVLGLGNL